MKQEPQTLDEFIRDLTAVHPMAKSEVKRRLESLIRERELAARIDENMKFRNAQVGDGKHQNAMDYTYNRIAELKGEQSS